MSSPEVYDEVGPEGRPTTLVDRTGRGSPAANQSKAEPFPASPAQGQAETPGAGDQQANSRGSGTAAGGAGNAADVPVLSDQAAPETSEELPPVSGRYVPDVDESTATRR